MLTLDIGCGNKCRGDVGCDIAIPTNKPIYFCRADAHMLPFRDKTFEVAFSYYFFEHLRNPEQAMKELIRVSRKSYVVTDHFLSIFCYLGGTHSHVWLLGKRHPLTFVLPLQKFLAKISMSWQLKRPLSEKTTDRIFATIERSVIIDPQTRRTTSFKALAEGIRKTRRRVSLSDE